MIKITNYELVDVLKDYAKKSGYDIKRSEILMLVSSQRNEKEEYNLYEFIFLMVNLQLMIDKRCKNENFRIDAVSNFNPYLEKEINDRRQEN